MTKKLMMLCVAAMAAMGAWATPKFGFWVEMHDVPAQTCACKEHRVGKNHYVMTRLGAIEGGKGSYVAIPVYGLDSELRDEDVSVTAGTYKDAGKAFVLSEEKMWTEYGRHFADAYNSGKMGNDIWDDDDIHWADDCDSEFSPKILNRDYWSGDAKSVLYFMSDSGPIYELVSGIWDDWAPVSGRQWIIVPTPKVSSVGKNGKITSFYITIKVANQYYSHLVEGVNEMSVREYKASKGSATVGAVAVPSNTGIVTGNGEYKKGSTITLKATSNKGYVFAGWYEDAACTKPYSAQGVDYAKESINHTVIDDNLTLFAKFKPIESDGDDIELLSSYGPFVPGTEVELNLGLVGYAAKKLPSGLKLDKKTGIVKGKAKKPGEYQVTFTKKGAETLTAKFIVGLMPEITIAMEGDTEKCKVTGASKPGKGYLVGKKVSLSAKGPKGTAFTGWFKDGAPWPNEEEYLEAKQKHVMTEENLSLVARFEKEKMSVSCDGLSEIVVGEEVSIPIAIETQSGVKSVKGSKLPSGLKVKKDKATGNWFVTGKPKKKGTWNATIKVTAKSGAVEQLSVVVTVGEAFVSDGNLTAANGYFRTPLKNGNGEKYTLSVGISNIDDFLPALNLNTSSAKLTVAGLPAGLKYDAKTGKITGIATKPGTYTVTLTVTDGKAKYVSTITIEVEALPDWVVGTFYGKEIARGIGYSEWVCPMQITVTISAVGKISIKGIEPGESGTGTSRSAQLTEVRDDGSYAFTVHHVSGRKGNDGYTEGDLEVVITPMVYGDNVEFGCCIIHDVGVCDEDDDPYESNGEAYQSLYSSKSYVSKLPAFVKNAVTVVSLVDDYGGYITLKYGANGAVTTAYSETKGGKATATGSAQLVPYEVDGNITKAWLYTALKPKGRDPFGVLLFLSIDTSNSNVYGDDVIVEDYLLEVEE